MTNKKLTGIEAVTLIKKALAHDGLERSGFLPGAGITGWAKKAGSNGFSVEEESSGKLTWNIVISGSTHLYYIADRNKTYPDKPESLTDEIKAVFAKLGLDVVNVEFAGFKCGLRDDISYLVRTHRPEWLERTPGRYQPSSGLELS
jgi:hypothetical protein